MFDPTLIPKQASEGLKAGYQIRPLVPEDYEIGACEVLKVLTEVGTTSKPEFDELLQYWAKLGIFYPVVIEGEGHIVASGMLIVEQKLIHSRASAGHIEDISVLASQQGMQLGKRLITALTGIAQRVGCYKVILDCDEKNVVFYEKCGYRRAGVEMELKF